MNRSLKEQFRRTYGYDAEDEDELRQFADEMGLEYEYDYYDRYRYRSPTSTARPDYSYFNSRDAGDADNNCPADAAVDVGSEFTSLMKEILGSARRNKKVERTKLDHELVQEFGYMLLVFFLKSSLYFALRYAEERSYYTNL